VCLSEGFESLSEGLQNALWEPYNIDCTPGGSTGHPELERPVIVSCYLCSVNSAQGTEVNPGENLLALLRVLCRN
jgi:hypothetical protein